MAYDLERITYFAKTDARGQSVPFGIKARDRQRHMYVIGKTGMGKSTLLENMAVQDIQNGEGMAFIDPHGSAAETLLEYIPEHRINDVVYFAPFDMEHPVSFNVMEDVGADKRHLVVSGLMSTFKKIWVDAWSARMEYILTNTLLALMEYPDSTLLSVNRMLADKSYREKVVANVTDPAVKAYWVDEFAGYTERFAAEALPAIQNKIGQFTGNPLIRNIIGQPHSSFDIRKLMDDRKILIMNLSKGLIGETNANLLGSMLTTRIYLAAMSRADLPVQVMKTMPNFYFYVDEFQSFANSTFANILSEARKYHLNLIIAHQYVAQMEEEVRDAVFGNVGTTVTFRVGPFDAEVLETVFAPKFVAQDLVNLGFAQIYLTLMIDGIGSQPFSAQTLPPIEPPPVSCRDMAIAASRKHFASTRAQAETLVAELHTPTPPSGSGGPPSSSGVSTKNNTSGYREQKSQKGSGAGGNQKATGNDRSAKRGTAESGAAAKPKRNDAPRKLDQNDSATPDLNELRGVLANISRAEETRDTPADHTKGAADTRAKQKETQQKNPAPSERSGPPPDTNRSDKGHAKQKPKRRAGNDETERSAKKPSAQPKTAPSESSAPPNTTESSLRAALADVLRQADDAATHQSKPAHPDATNTDTAVAGSAASALSPAPSEDAVPTPPPEASEKSDTGAAPESHTSGSTPTAATDDDALSPKKLERMMRVTTYDKSPFRNK